MPDDYSVHEAMSLLQEKWVLHIVQALLNDVQGFNELARAVGGVNPTTLSQRLVLLEAKGILTKTVESNMPPKTRYELTEAGRGLAPVLEAISAWAADNRL